MITASAEPTPCEEYPILLLVDEAFDISVIWVLSVIEATVPIVVPPVVFITFPILISLKNKVFVPVMLNDAVEEMIVPVLNVLGHAVALQLPVVRLVTVAA
jgi:hypothetical protein